MLSHFDELHTITIVLGLCLDIQSNILDDHQFW